MNFGGCGACVVLLSKYVPVLGKVEDFTVSSCLTLLCSINGCSITTTEGLGNSKDGFHSIHQRFTGFHASQCGFCTPGMCISFFGALVNAEKIDRPKFSPGFSKLTAIEAEKLLQEIFVAVLDIGPSLMHAKVLQLILEELQNLLKTTDANTGVRVKLVVGNTRMGYHKELGHYDKYIDLRYIPEMSMIGRDRGIEIGATVTISKVIEALKEESKGIELKCCQLSSGAVGTKRAIRARKVEVKLGCWFSFDFFGPLTSSISNGWRDGYSGISMFEDVKLKEKCDNPDDVQFPTLLSSSKQVVQLNRGCHPVGEPIPKSGASLQASGEAVYVDDIPSPGNRLHGAFIYSTKPFARVKGIKFNSESLPDGVTALISYKDIPIGGQNIGLVFAFGPEPLFAEKLTQYAGEPLAFVLADTQKHADIASNLAVVDYDLENLEPPILTVEEAIERSSIFEVPPVVYPEKVGDLSKGMAQADHKILSAEIKLGLQYHFYMENQTALAALDEDNCMVVYSSTQCSEYAHVAIVKCLGVPEHNVRVLTRRVGGGLGGKGLKAMPCLQWDVMLWVATACALAAHKLQCPVRTYLSRKTDVIMTGGRHPMKITYSVGFKSNGKITALQLDVLINASIYKDASPLMPRRIVSELKKYDWGALSFDIKVRKTNLSSKSAMRAPGDAQGSYIAEAVIEHVASFLSLDADSVRARNLHTYDRRKLFYDVSVGEPLEYTLTSIWERLATSSSFNQRIEIIKEFNRYSVWKKRGISRIPIMYNVTMRPTPGKVSILNDGSIVVEFGGIEMDQGLWTKVKQTAAFVLSSIKCDGAGDLLDKVRVIQTDTLSLIQGGYNAGSTASESSCEAVRLCCEVLVERLIPLKERLLVQLDSIRWEMLIHQAYLEAVHLSANSYFVPDSTSKQYLNYGAAVSEVEVDVLTGQTTILRSDILCDCGQSINPAVDLGQIEGAFVQGIGFFMLEEYTTNSDGLSNAEGTWTYKIPTLDTIPKQFNVEILNSGHHQNRFLSSKASSEPPLLLAASVQCATRNAIREARKQLDSWGCVDRSNSKFQLNVPATLPVVKELCGLDNVEKYLQWKIGNNCIYLFKLKLDLEWMVRHWLCA
ncbi:hypothetical protein GH714_004434 [Hevea brasiliensis]|uniref:indole-3-acetaldehyde oxidase n=1 Tax=Hevea brasiliensis TaxID=3981 RepID=A0A6A6LEI7_HEVBR|nr:hypothetical protein GH714_004434 [Hevea brasiliensis]